MAQIFSLRIYIAAWSLPASSRRNFVYQIPFRLPTLLENMPPPSLQLGFFLAALAAAQLPITTLNNSADDLAQAANLERFWSYDRSPPVYPSPPMSGVGHWEEAYQEARALVAQMTNDEKNNVTYGTSIPVRCPTLL
jgi:hypothetical protein